MTRILEENKFLAWLTAGILVTLVVALKVAAEYMKHESSYTKGEAPIMVLVYVPTILLATTLLLTLVFRHWLWHMLFVAALTTCIAVIYFIVHIIITVPGDPYVGPESFLDYI